MRSKITARKSTVRVAAWVLGVQAIVFTLTASALDLNRIILQVNDEIFTLHDYEQRKAAEIEALLADPKVSPSQSQEFLAKAGKLVLQQVFRELLLKSRARQLGIQIEDTQIDAAVREVQQRQGIASQEELIQALRSAGLTLEQLRENMRGELLWNEVIGKEVARQIEIGEEEVRAYYRNHQDDFKIAEERQLREIIVLEASGLPLSEREQLATEIRASIRAGATLDAVVEPYRASGKTTGAIDLGWLRREELENALAEAAFSLKSGEVSAPVLARGGHHILQVTGIKEAGVQPFKDVEERIRNLERGRRFEKELRTYLANLEKQSYIRENLPPDGVGFRSADVELPEDELELFRRPLPEQAAPATPEGTPPAGNH